MNTSNLTYKQFLTRFELLRLSFSLTGYFEYTVCKSVYGLNPMVVSQHIDFIVRIECHRVDEVIDAL
jgi:hypothetical protein